MGKVTGAEMKTTRVVTMYIKRYGTRKVWQKITEKLMKQLQELVSFTLNIIGLSSYIFRVPLVNRLIGNFFNNIGGNCFQSPKEF